MPARHRAGDTQRGKAAGYQMRGRARASCSPGSCLVLRRAAAHRPHFPPPATHCSLVPSTEGLNGSSPRPGPSPGPAGRPARSPATAMPGPRGPEAPPNHRAQLREGPQAPLWRLEDSVSLPGRGRERGSVRATRPGPCVGRDYTSQQPPRRCRKSAGREPAR